MSHIPNVRTDENYNQKFLNERDRDFLHGFDWATEMAVDNFFDNDMFDLMDADSYIGHILNEKLPEELRDQYTMEFAFNGREDEERNVETYADLIRMKLLEWIEMERNELVTSTLDGYDEDEYEKLKAEAEKAGAASDPGSDNYKLPDILYDLISEGTTSADPYWEKAERLTLAVFAGYANLQEKDKRTVAFVLEEIDKTIEDPGHFDALFADIENENIKNGYKMVKSVCGDTTFKSVLASLSTKLSEFIAKNE